jgi:hypothetical protein
MFQCPIFEIEAISDDEMQESLKDPNTHVFVEGRERYRGFKCKSLTCKGLYCLNSVNEQPDICIYCNLKNGLVCNKVLSVKVSKYH